MPVVCRGEWPFAPTSPILNLAIIGRFSLLHQQFGTIHIATGVLEELRVEEDLPGSEAKRAGDRLTMADCCANRKYPIRAVA